MSGSVSETTQADKIEALTASIWATYIMLPLLYGGVFILWRIGFEVQLLAMNIIFLMGLAMALVQHYMVHKKWLIDTSYRFLYSLLFWILVATGIRQTGCILSPFVWVGLFAVINETMYYSFVKGLILAIAYVLFLWMTIPLDYLNILPHPPWIPGFDPYQSGRFAFSLLTGYSLFFLVIPLSIGFLSEQLRKEKRTAERSADEQKKAYRMSLSVMKDLDAAKKELETKISEVEDSRRVTLHLLQDIEEQRDLSQKRSVEIEKLYVDLKEVDRMKTEFLSVISHELRTPITPILGYITLFLQEKFGKLDYRYKRGAEIINKESAHLLFLIDNILDVAGLERGFKLELGKTPLSLKVLSKELAEVMQLQLENRQMSIEVKLPDDFPTLIADEKKLRRLLTNILGNAFKFSPRGGKIVISGKEIDGFIEIRVADNGIGLAKENLKKIFEKFYQVDSSHTRATGGMGLGLAVAMDIVENHGGKIWAESDGLGKGTEMCFTLPLGG